MSSDAQKNAGYLLPEPIVGYDLICATLKIPDAPEYRAAFLGALNTLKVWWSWEKSYDIGDTRATQAATYWRELLNTWLEIGVCAEGETVDYRQNEENPCLMEYSKDGGDTWLPMFDFKLCEPAYATKLLQYASGSYGNPAAPTETFTSQIGDTPTMREQRNQALCYAAKYIVQAMCDGAYEVCQGTVTIETIGSVAIGIVAAIIAAGVIITAPWFVPVIAGAISALLAIQSSVTALGCNAWFSSTNRAALECVMYKNLINKGVSIENFQTAFESVGCLTAEQQNMAEILDNALNNNAEAQVIFANFMGALGDANAVALAGNLLEDCVCVDTVWCYSWDLRQALGIWEVVAGEWVQGAGVKSITGALIKQCNGTPYSNAGVEIIARFVLPDGSALGDPSLSYKSASFTIQYFLSTSSNHQSFFRTNAVCHAFSGANYSIDTQNPQVTGEVELKISYSNNSAGAALAEIDSVALFGTGVNPFAACSNC